MINNIEEEFKLYYLKKPYQNLKSNINYIHNFRKNELHLEFRKSWKLLKK
jgi:hypothetical protein